MKKFTQAILIIILLFGCNKKDVILEVEENSVVETIETEIQEDDSISKPLLMINENDNVNIMVRADGAPGMYLAEDGEVYGFYVDLEKMIMAEMGQNYTLIPYTDVGPIAIGLKTGEFHIALSTPDLADYRTFLNLSIPYEVLHYVTFVQNDNYSIGGVTKKELIESLFGKKVGVQTQGHIYQELRDFKEIILLEYPTTTQALEDLNNGILDAVPDVERIGLYYSELNSWDIKPVGEPIINHDITTSFSQAIDVSLLERYNIALQKIIDDGRLEGLYIEYFNEMSDDDKPWID